MKFCDHCEQDVKEPCKDLVKVASCKNYITYSKKIDYSDNATNKYNITKVSDSDNTANLAEGKIYDGKIQAEAINAERMYNHAEEVNHPSHYNRGSIEVKDFIKDQGLDPKLSNVIKYTCRAGFKNIDEWEKDLRKAIFYIEDFIKDVNETGEFPYMETKKVPRNR